MKLRVAVLGCSVLAALPVIAVVSMSRDSSTAVVTTLGPVTTRLAVDDFGVTAGLPRADETQEEYEARLRAGYVDSKRADTKVRIVSAERTKQCVALTIEVVGEIGTEVDVVGASALAPPEFCSAIPGGFRCVPQGVDAFSQWPETAVWTYTRTLEFETAAAEGEPLVIDVMSTSAPYDDILRGELEVDLSNNAATIEIPRSAG